MAGMPMHSALRCVLTGVIQSSTGRHDIVPLFLFYTSKLSAQPIPVVGDRIVTLLPKIGLTCVIPDPIIRFVCITTTIIRPVYIAFFEIKQQ